MITVDIEKKMKGFHLRSHFSAGDEVVALFGPSGSGKSLTLQCIAGLLRPDAGRIVIGQEIVFDSARGINLVSQKRRIGFVFQNYALFPHLSVAQNIGYGLNHLTSSERKSYVARAVKQMRLEGKENCLPRELSGGQQQRVAIGRALITEPSVLLLDEPFSALDSAIRSKLQTDLLQLLRSLKITTILVTHNLDEAYLLSEKMVVYDAGQVLQVGSRDEIINSPLSRSVARFTGTKNIFSGTVINVSDDSLVIDGEGLRVTTLPFDCKEGESVQFCIRPDLITLFRHDRIPGDRIKDNQMEGRIVKEVNHGPGATLFFKVSGPANGKDYDLQIEVPTHTYRELNLSMRKDWTVCLKKESIHVF